jgi:uncharacterized Fe-S cluster-containing protein
MYCSAHTKHTGKCCNRAKYILKDKYFCKIHAKQRTDKLEEAEVECPICINSVPLIKSTRTSCGHEFCKACLHKWLRGHNNCPICRTVLVDPVTADHQDTEYMANEMIVRLINTERIHVNTSNQFIIDIIDIDELELLEHWNNHTLDASTVIYIA